VDIKLHIPPDIEPGLRAQARAEGVSLDVLLESLIRRGITSAGVAHSPDLSLDEWMDRFNAWLASNAGNSVVLPNEAMERESIYGDHGQ